LSSSEFIFSKIIIIKISWHANSFTITGTSGYSWHSWRRRAVHWSQFPGIFGICQLIIILYIWIHVETFLNIVQQLKESSLFFFLTLFGGWGWGTVPLNYGSWPGDGASYPLMYI
jgi:hypothetical protein